MNLLFRLIRVVIAALLNRGSLAPMGLSVVAFRVWPNDLDANMHMNNGRYLTVMDLGRVDQMIRTGMGRVLLQRRWSPVLGSATIRFRRPLMPFQRYLLKTRILCWDDKWIYLEQAFETMDGHVAAVGVVKGLFRGKGRSIPTAELVAAIGVDTPSPPMPPEVAAWQEAESALTRSARAAA